MTDASEAQNKGSNKMLGLLTSVVLGITVGAPYPTYQYLTDQYDGRYAKKDDTITVAEASEIRKQLTEFTDRSTANTKKLSEFSTKLDSILYQQARKDVWDAEDRLKRLLDTNAASSEIRDAEKRLQTCTEYYDCLTNDGINCGSFK